MIDLAPAASRVADLVAATNDSQLAGPTPCPELTVGDLLDHVSTFAQAFAAKAQKRDDAYCFTAHGPGPPGTQPGLQR